MGEITLELDFVCELRVIKECGGLANDLEGL
jgi:hypothetical protein